MKGLLKKDLLMIVKYCRFLVLMCLVFAVMSGFSTEEDGSGNFFFLVYPVLLGSIMPITLMSYDERSHWDLYCSTLPLSRKTVVNERYLLGLLCFLAFFAVTMLSQAVALLPRGRGAELGDLVGVLCLIGLLPPAVMLPICFRWGVEKARILYYVLIGVMVAGGLIFSRELMLTGAMQMGSAAWLIPLLALLLFAASWVLSVKLYQKREF